MYSFGIVVKEAMEGRELDEEECHVFNDAVAALTLEEPAKRPSAAQLLLHPLFSGVHTRIAAREAKHEAALAAAHSAAMAELEAEAERARSAHADLVRVVHQLRIAVREEPIHLEYV